MQALQAAAVFKAIKSNLIFRTYAENAPGDMAGQARRRVPLGALPAMPFEVVP
jgi:hypothetical protein